MSVASVPMDEVYKPTYQNEICNSGHKIDPDNAKNLSETSLNDYIAHFIQQQKYRNYRDEGLWEEFIEHFDIWTKQTLDIPSHTAIIDLRDYLRQNGVFVTRAAPVSIAKELAKTAFEEKQHPWSAEEIEGILEKNETFNPRFHPDFQSTKASAIRSRSESSQFDPATQIWQSIEEEIHRRPDVNNQTVVRDTLPYMSQIGTIMPRAPPQQPRIYSQSFLEIPQRQNIEDYYRIAPEYNQQIPQNQKDFQFLNKTIPNHPTTIPKMEL